MRTMRLPQVPPIPSSIDDCIALYSHRLRGDFAPHPEIAASLLGYMGWPNDRAKRNRWMATVISHIGGAYLKDAPTKGWGAFQSFGGLEAVTSAALEAISRELVEVSIHWCRAADVFQLVVDMSLDDRIEFRGGPSISKAVELLELPQDTPGHTRFRHAWAHLRDVAHLIAASAFIASEGQKTRIPDSSVIMNATWLAPEAVLPLAAGYQNFGLQKKSHGQTMPILPSDTMWRLTTPPMANPLLPFRRLTDEQLEFLKTRRTKGK